MNLLTAHQPDLQASSVASLGKRAATLATVVIAVAGCAVSKPPMFLNSKVGSTSPFSEGVRVGNTLYLSGQIGTVPGSAKTTLAPGGIQGEGKQVMENVKASFKAHGYEMSDVVKCTAMLADMADWPAFNEIYKTYFAPGKYPARSAFGAKALVFDARIELECIADKAY